MSTNKLNPVYEAIENHQYIRGIRLCLSLPQSNVMGKALLAHCYAKSNQRYKALLTLQSILGANFFPELRLEIAYSLERRVRPEKQTGTQQASPPKKVGKKGKKKGFSTVAAPRALDSPTVSVDPQYYLSEWDLIDQLDIPPKLPDNWEELPPADQVPIDEDLEIISTMAITMTNYLRLPLTSFQLYSWANTKIGDNEFLLSKAYLSGFAVLVAPQYEHIASQILSRMQTFAVQLSRVQGQKYPGATAWAAQTALWQVQYTQQQEPSPRLAMLPRLAESLALRCVEANDNIVGDGNNSSHLRETESFLLYMRCLEVQNKYEEQVKVLRDRVDKCKEMSLNSSKMPAPPISTLLELLAMALERLGQTDRARVVLEELLRDHFPDDWRFWTKHLDSGNVEASESLAEELISVEQKYRLRGPHLLLVEVAKRALEKSNGDRVSVESLLSRILTYASTFSDKASCVFSDLRPYLDILLRYCTEEDGRKLLKAVSQSPEGIENCNESDARTGKALLRAFIFGVQVTYTVVLQFPELRGTELPSWQCLLSVWKKFGASAPTDQAQKESRLEDNLLLLAAQQLLVEKPHENCKLLAAACILEAGIQSSPHNAYLKIYAMFVYKELNSISRAWELSKELHIKHIQHESCAYLLLSLLQSGGFYRETISVCQEILRLQTSHLRDANEFISSSMENGTASKADDLLNFHRTRMNKSLTTLEAKGLVLDCAPLFVQDDGEESLGAVHGIVGGENDVERANQMIAEAHNPCAAFSLLRLYGSATDLSIVFSDNRDFGILSHDILIERSFDSSTEVLESSLRRGHHHRLLIRAALCLESTKPPKKGKPAKNSEHQEKRCRSLLESVQKFSTGASSYQEYHRAMHSICCTVAALGAGVYMDGVPIETLEERENNASEFLKKATESVAKCLREISSVSPSHVSSMSRLIPDCVIPLFALTRMCSKGADLYGWGIRKHKTRVCAASLKGLVSKISQLLDEMVLSLKCLPYQGLNLGDHQLPIEDIVGEFIAKNTVATIVSGQEVTRDRIVQVVECIKTSLDRMLEE